MAGVDLTVGKINTVVFLGTKINRTINIRKLSIKIWVIQEFLVSGSLTFAHITLDFAIIFVVSIVDISNSRTTYYMPMCQRRTPWLLGGLSFCGEAFGGLEYHQN
jgi:hypothetical protein